MSDPSTLRDDEKQFIQEVATMLAPRGLSPSVGRVYGYLMLKQQPLDVDAIAQDLEISRVAAWNGARALEPGGHVVKTQVPGSKRVLYAISNQFSTPVLGQVAILGSLAALLDQCANSIAEGEASQQLQERSHFYQTLHRVMREAIETLEAERQQQQAELALTGEQA